MSESALPSDEVPPVSPPAGAAAPAPPSRFTAVLLAAVVPGAGHIYARRLMPGLVWMAIALGVYATSLVAGLVLHGLCVVSTAFTIRRP
jgi:hypothetical protein